MLCTDIFELSFFKQTILTYLNESFLNKLMIQVITRTKVKKKQLKLSHSLTAEGAVGVRVPLYLGHS